MSDEEIKELIQSEIDERIERLVEVGIDEKFEEISDQIAQEQKRNTVLGIACIGLAIVVAVFAIFVNLSVYRKIPSMVDNEAAINSETVSRMLEPIGTDERLVLKGEVGLVTSRVIDGYFEVETDDEWRVFVSDTDEHFAAIFRKSTEDGSIEVFMLKEPDETYAYLNCTSRMYDGVVSKTHEDKFFSRDEEKSETTVYIVRVEGYEFPLSPNQLESIQNYLKLVPISA